MLRYAVIYLLLFASLTGSIGAFANDAAATTCSPAQSQRNVVLDSLNTLGTQLALGRLCRVREDTLHQLKHQTLNRFAACLQSFQVKATEIQDALEAGRLLARDTFTHAKNRVSLCEEVRLATN